MSHRASEYVIGLLEQDTQLPRGARSVALAAAARANSRSAATYSGGWLARATGLTAANVWRNLHRLEAAGVLAIEYRPGRSAVIRFPIAGYIAPANEVTAPGRRDSQGAFHPSFCGCPECAELAV